MSAYAWIITRDHLDEPGSDYSALGVTGPADASTELLADVQRSGPHRHRFRMYDDDGELYFSGCGTWLPDADAIEEGCYGPLADYGAPDSGCTLIEWDGHPEWNCG